MFLNSIGEVKTICKLYSGKAIKLNFATENQCQLGEDLAFSILGKFLKTHILRFRQL